MILITLGTQDKAFTRVLEKVDELIEKKIIKEEVIVQAGHTKYKSKNMKIKMKDILELQENIIAILLLL